MPPTELKLRMKGKVQDLYLRLMSKPERETHVLLVEDDEIDVMNVQRAFMKNDISHPLHVADNGETALAMLRGESGDFPRNKTCRCVVLLDINMPRMNGIDFLRELRSDPELDTTMVTVLTTSDHEEDRLNAFKLNVAGYFLKPVKFPSFVEVMSTLNQYWALCETA